MEVISPLISLANELTINVKEKFKIPVKLLGIIVFVFLINSVTDWYYYHNLKNKIEAVQGINAILKDSTIVSNPEREGLKAKRMEVLTHYSFSERVLGFFDLAYANGYTATNKTTQQQNTTITALKVKPKQVKRNSVISIAEISFWNRLIYTGLPTLFFIFSLINISLKNKQENTKIILFTNVIIIFILLIITLFFNWLIPIIAPNSLHNPLLNVGFSFMGYVVLVFVFSGLINKKTAS